MNPARRDPAVLWLALLVPVVQAVVALWITDSPGLAGGVNAAAVALAGAITAFTVKSDNQLPAIMGAVQAVLALVAGFVYPLAPEQQAAVLGPISILVAFAVRDRVAAPIAAPVVETVR